MILTQKRRSYIKRDLHIKRDTTTKFSIFHVESVWDTSLLGMRNEKRMFRKRYVCRKRCVAWQSDARAARHPRELLNVSKICRFPVFCWSLLVYVGLFCCTNVCFEIPHFRHEKWRILSLCLFWCVKSLLMYERLFWVRIISFDVYRSLLLCKCLFWVRYLAFDILHMPERRQTMDDIYRSLSIYKRLFWVRYISFDIFHKSKWRQPMDDLYRSLSIYKRLFWVR